MCHDTWKLTRSLTGLFESYNWLVVSLELGVSVQSFTKRNFEYMKSRLATFNLTVLEATQRSWMDKDGWRCHAHFKLLLTVNWFLSTSILAEHQSPSSLKEIANCNISLIDLLLLIQFIDATLWGLKWAFVSRRHQSSIDPQCVPTQTHLSFWLGCYRYFPWLCTCQVYYSLYAVTFHFEHGCPTEINSNIDHLRPTVYCPRHQVAIWDELTVRKENVYIQQKYVLFPWIQHHTLTNHCVSPSSFNGWNFVMWHSMKFFAMTD